MTKYNPTDLEQKWYAYWLAHNYFHSTPDERTPYTIVIPPPNVTGVLHMGHMLNNTIQDVLIRRARLKGFNACWVPGTDHASIATEAKVVAKLKEQGIKKSDLTREEFLVHAWEWTHQYGGVILEQLKKLGCSCDWERTKFTMDDELSASVIKVFVDLYNKGQIYRGYRMVNWDPEAKTTISDEEVIYEERQGFLYHLKYQIKGTNEYLVIATTRPETIFGDTAICINPNDKRYTHLKGKKVIIPIVGRDIPIIEDDYVDIDFGTGCLKVTPAHDFNDFEIMERYNMKAGVSGGEIEMIGYIPIFNDDATMNNNIGLNPSNSKYVGKDRFVVRKEIVAELEAKDLLAKKETYTNKVGTSERTKAVIEPRLSDQWFLKMDTLIQPAIKAVLEDESIKLYPKKFENTYRHWVENVRDWNISRQLWWGQQIPAYYYGEGKNQFVVAETKAEALVLAKEKSGNTHLTEGYAQLKYQLSPALSANVGLRAHYFGLSKELSLESRAGLAWKLSDKHSLSFGYGKHSQPEDLNVYMIEVGGVAVNKDLKLSDAHHFVLGYDWMLTDKLRFKAEAYYQYLWNILGEEGTSYSLINLRRALYLNKALVNNTKGRNYGIDLTLERFLGDNYYYLITGSIFKSEYKAGDNVWRNTRYNKGFVLNALFGKEFYFANNRKVLDVNARVSVTGGERYSPILESQSLAQKRVIFDERFAFSEQFRTLTYADLTVNYRINHRKSSSVFSLQMKNVLGAPIYIEHNYNYQTNQIELSKATLVVPNISYKIEF